MSEARDVQRRAQSSRHLVVVDAFVGQTEFLSDEPEKQVGAMGLGLPWPEIERLADCRTTFLVWDEWYAYETRHGSPFTWASAQPITRPSSPIVASFVSMDGGESHVRRAIPVRDPEDGHSLADRGPGPMSHGLLAEHDAHFWLSVCLRESLIELARTDPYSAVMLPMWGGLGYASQLSRACGLQRELDVPFLVAVTDASVQRQRANQEGEWTRDAVTRRQMEDMSLALADAALAFGPRGIETAERGRTKDSSRVILAPRRIADTTLDAIDAAAATTCAGALNIFLHEPLQPAAGVLAALDATAVLVRDSVAINFTAAGPDCSFAPMHPRTFRDYWSSRGFVKDLVRRGAWQWQTEVVRENLPLRVHASSFEYLPDPGELARGSAMLLSPAAAEGLDPDAQLPKAILLSTDPDALSLADALRRIIAAGPEAVDTWRRETCAAIVLCHRGPRRVARIEAVADLLDRAFERSLPEPSISEALRMTLDRTRPLNSIAPLRHSKRDRAHTSLAVVITSYELGELVRESAHSVWASRLEPDELLIIDDGSTGEETATALARLESEARSRNKPLRIVRQDNRGLAAARNRGLAEANAGLISFLDGDDLIDPDFYSLAVALLGKFVDLGGVAAWARIFGDDVPAGGWFWNPAQPELPALLERNSVIVPCVMRTDDLRDLGGYDEGQRYNYEDWELSIRMLAAGLPILTIPSYLMRYRVRRSSLYRSMTSVQDQVMRERMFLRHRDVVQRFGVELAMLVMDRKSRSEAAQPESIFHRLARAIPGFVRNVTAGGPRA